MAEYKPLYHFSLKEAVEHGERDEWRESYKENCDCARAIEKTIDAHYIDNRLEDCADEIIRQYGFERVNWVLANTVQQHIEDGRFSEDNKQWAKKLYIPKDDVRWHFSAERHPGLTNLFISQVRKAWQSLGLFDYTHCTDSGRTGVDFTGKVCVLKGLSLSENYRKPEFQLFLAQDGNGCRPEALGTKVFGLFLADGEKATFCRSDFIGVIKDDNLPEWAKEKLAEFQPPEPSETDGITMGEM